MTSIIEGKDHECDKKDCAYCNRFYGASRKSIVDTLNLKGVWIITDEIEKELQKTLLKKDESAR